MVSQLGRSSVRRFFRISLRWVFVLLTFLCALIAWKERQPNRQKEAVAWVKENGGYVTYDYELAQPVAYSDENGDVTFGRKIPGPKWLREMIGVDFLRMLSLSI